MNLKHISIIATLALTVILTSCDKEDDEKPESPAPPQPQLIFKFKFDSTQVRLDNVGNPSTVPAGNAAQSPRFKLMSQHYIELANDTHPLGSGAVLYTGTSTTAGGSNAINHSLSVLKGDEEIFFSKPLSEITPGTYKWLRVSLAYQSYDITYKAAVIPGNGLDTGTIASFIGYKTYINSYKINGNTYVPSVATGGPGNHTQGYWGFETNVGGTNYFIDGQSPGTTVPNPFTTSPIPSGSCVVTGQFVNNALINSTLTITGTETSDIVIMVSLSTNKSFEWTDPNADGYYQPDLGNETVVDMGIRGMIPIKQ